MIITYSVKNDILITYIKPNAKLNASSYKDIQADTWTKYGIDINAEKEDLLELLSQKIFVKDNKYRYLIEQRNRLAST
jgi:hypothetical protein